MDFATVRAMSSSAMFAATCVHAWAAVSAESKPPLPFRVPQQRLSSNLRIPHQLPLLGHVLDREAPVSAQRQDRRVPLRGRRGVRRALSAANRSL